MSKAVKQYDYLIIGTGSGLILASAFLESKKKVAIIEKGLFGGTCLNRGCIPSKRLIHAADIIHTLHRAKQFQIEIGKIKVDYQKLVKKTHQMVHKEALSMKAFYKDSSIDVYPFEGKFIDDYQVKVDGKIIHASKILLDIGSVPYIPPIPGLEKTPYITSDEALLLEKLPSHLIILGGGYIGLEMAHLFSSMGSKVTIVERGEILAREDPELVAILKGCLSKKVTFLEKREVEKVSFAKGKFSLLIKQKKEKKRLQGDKLLVATGRKPPVDRLDLQKTSIEVDKKGYILVDRQLQTTQKNVWAFGDCIHPIQLKHLANFEAKFLRDNLFRKRKKDIAYPPIPYAIFTCPTIASVGNRENSSYVRSAWYDETGKGWFLGEKGYLKLFFSKKKKELIGASMIGKNAEEMIHILSIAIEQKMKERDLQRSIFIHPTLSEIIPSALSD